MSGLRISPTLTLPLDVCGEAIAVLAKRGAGKTNTGRVLAEELVAARVQTVVLDPVGAWWGLRSSADGKSEGLPLPILGGAHGDVPLEPTAGALLADVVIDAGQSLEPLEKSELAERAGVSASSSSFTNNLGSLRSLGLIGYPGPGLVVALQVLFMDGE